MTPGAVLAVCRAALDLNRSPGADTGTVLSKHGLGSQLEPLVRGLASPTSGTASNVGDGAGLVLEHAEERYLFESFLGSGAFGAVFAGRDLRDQARVAIKVATSDDAIAGKMYEWEVSAYRQLTDVPGVLPLRTAFEIENTGILVTDLCTKSLAEHLRANGQMLKPSAARNIMQALVATIKQLHAKKLVHRDIKPENILLHPTLGWVISDFGLCVADRQDGVASVPAGSFEFMAPEVLAGHAPRTEVDKSDPDVASDIYSLGCLFYRMLEGHPPVRMLYDADGRRRLLEFCDRVRGGHGHSYVNSPHDIRNIIDKCLEHMPLRRYDAGSLLRDLEEKPTPEEAAFAALRLRRFQPVLPAQHVLRETLLNDLHRLLVNQSRAALRQIVASGDGGHGKTLLAIAYAEQAMSRRWKNVWYPGGVYFANVGIQTAAAALAALADPHSVESFQLDTETLARLVIRKLESLDTPLLIIDNVDSQEQWAGMRRLVPAGSVTVLVTTREDRLQGLDALSVDRLELSEAEEIFRKFRSDALIPSNAGHIKSVYDELEGMAFAVAAAGALMMLDPSMSWSDLAALVKRSSLAQLPGQSEIVRATRVQANDREWKAQSTLTTVNAVLDALRARLNPLERSALDIAARCPQDHVVREWLVAVTKSQVPPSDAPTAHADAEAAVEHLVSLGLLSPRESAPDPTAKPSIQVYTLHRLHTRRARELLENDVDRLKLIDTKLARHVDQRLEVVIGNPMFPKARAVPELRSELSPLAAFCDMLWERGNQGPAIHIAAQMGFALVETWRPIDVDLCLRADRLVRAADGGELDSSDLPRALSWRAVWESRTRNGGRAAWFTDLALRHHRTRNRTETADYAIDLGIGAMCIFEYDLDRLAQAEQMARDSIRIYRWARPDDPLTPYYAIDVLAGKQRDAGDCAKIRFDGEFAGTKYGQAEQTLQEGLGSLGDDGRTAVLRAKLLYRLGTVLTRVPGREKDAKTALDEALKIYKGLYDKVPNHRDLRNTHDALDTLRRAIEERRRKNE